MQEIAYSWGSMRTRLVFMFRMSTNERRKYDQLGIKCTELHSPLRSEIEGILLAVSSNLDARRTLLTLAGACGSARLVENKVTKTLSWISKPPESRGNISLWTSEGPCGRCVLSVP